MNPTAPTPAREYSGVTTAIFREEILPNARPALLKGVARDWPAARAGASSPTSMADYLRRFDAGHSAATMFGTPSIGGFFFYNDELTAHNFERRPEPIGRSLDLLLSLLDTAAPPAVYVGAVPIAQSLPGFERENVLDLLPGIAPRVWIGNRVTVQTHYDISSNVACVICGRRRFTLFPPEQLSNLYVGPLEFTLAGQPVSMVRLDAPDHARFPRFREALAHAVVADLEPGDALFIPYMWWHHVESRDAFNVLVNYWWDDVPAWSGAPFEALVHALLAIRALPPEKRAVWRAVFEHYVFQNDGDPVAHLAPGQRGIQGAMSPQIASRIREWLLHTLGRGK